MDISEPSLKVCRLCLFAVSPGTFYKINNFISPKILSIKDKIITILPEIDLDICADPVICRECFINVEHFYTFKDSCLRKNIHLVCNAEVFGQDVELDKMVQDIGEENATKKSIDPQDPENLLMVSSVDHNYNPNHKYSQKEIDNMKPSDKIKLMPKKFDLFFTKFIKSHPNQTTYTCDVCGESDMSIHMIREHFIVTKHYSEEKYNFRRRPNTCTICNTSFKNEEMYNQHEKKHLRKVVCCFCNRTVKHSVLGIHLRSKHSGQELYLCKYCRKTYPYQEACSVHEAMHLNQVETAHYCSLCHLYFDTKQAMTSHTNKMH